MTGRTGEGSGRWGLAWTFAGALLLRAWSVTPVAAAARSDIGPPFVIPLVACLPLGLLVAAVSARLARGGSGVRTVAWIVTAAYGAWVGVWASLMVETGGRLECTSPEEAGCAATTGQRVATLVAVVLVLTAGRLFEARRSRGAPSAPS